MTKNYSLTSLFARYVSFNVLGMIGFSVYILADTYFVANGVGADGLAALNFAIVVFCFMQAMGLMIGIGGATQFQIFSSQGNTEKANQAFTTSFAMALCAALLLMVAVGFFSDPIASFLGADEITAPLMKEYLKVLLVFAPAFLLNAIFLPFVRNDGAPKLAMIAMLVSSLANIIFDWIFIFGLGWGMFGAALATGASPLFSLMMLSLHLFWRNNTFRLVRMRPQLKLMGRIAALGFSSSIVEASSGLVLLVFNLIILQFAGNTGVAAYGIIANFALVATALFVGIAQGIQPLVSGARACRNTREIKSLLRLTLGVAFVFSIVVFGVVYVFAEPLALAFNKDNDPQLTTLAVEGMRIYFAGYFFAGINIVMAAFFSAVERPALGLTISLLRGLVVMLPLAFFLSSLFEMTGVWLTYAATEFVTFVVAIVFIAWFIRHLRMWSDVPEDKQDVSPTLTEKGHA